MSTKRLKKTTEFDFAESSSSTPLGAKFTQNFRKFPKQLVLERTDLEIEYFWRGQNLISAP